METLQENKNSNSHRLIQNLKVLPQNWEKLEILQHVTILIDKCYQYGFFDSSSMLGIKTLILSLVQKKGRKKLKMS